MNILDTKEQFAEALKRLEHEKIIGIDTEFVRKKTYHAQLCLLQISTPNSYFAVDPLNVDVKDFCKILESNSIIKIFHASSQDIGIFYQMFNTITNNIFDTQEAAKFSEIKRQISYRELCSRVLKVEIKKDQGFRDWSIRPLPSGMIEYALQDVKYLISLYHELKNRISKAGSVTAFNERMKFLSSPENFNQVVENSWKKVKIFGSDNKMINRIKELAQIREVIAINKDIPRKHVLSDDDLILIAKRLPKDLSSFYRMDISKQIDQKLAEKLVNICSYLN